MKPLVTLRKAFSNPNLLGSDRIMGGASREPMRSILLASQGERLTNSEREHWRRLTGREREPLLRAQELDIIAGRRSGKTSGVGALAVYLAALCDYSDCLSPGETGVVMVLAGTQDQAKVLLDYIGGIFDDTPSLKALVVARPALSITLSNHIRIEVRATSFRSLRGPTLIAVLCDEISFWRSEDSANPDTEIITAVRPGLLTTKGQLITLGSPFARLGFAYGRFVKYYGPDGDPRIIIAKGPTRDFNLTITDDEIAREVEIAPDPVATRAEYACEFRSDIAAHFNREIVEAAVVPGQYELPRIHGVSYVGFVDPAGGSGTDEMALAIAHLENNVAVLDCLRAAKPPFSPPTVVADFAAVLKSYGVHTVRGDRFGGDWPLERFAEHGIHYETETRPTSDIYKEAVPLFTASRVELLDNAKLVAQLIALERRIAKSGKESIGHATNAHDDLANSVCGALTLAGGNYDTLLTRYADFLVDKKPVEIPRACRAVFATITVDPEGRAAVAYFALTKILPATLILADFETGRYDTGIYERAATRLEQLADAHHAIQIPIYADAELAKDGSARGCDVTSLAQLTTREGLGAIAASYVEAGRVKISEDADAKARKEQHGLSLDFRFAKDDDPLKLAIIHGVVAGLDEASA